jgi:hypothetical protein
MQHNAQAGVVQIDFQYISCRCTRGLLLRLLLLLHILLGQVPAGAAHP